MAGNIDIRTKVGLRKPLRREGLSWKHRHPHEGGTAHQGVAARVRHEPGGFREPYRHGPFVLRRSRDREKERLDRQSGKDRRRAGRDHGRVLRVAGLFLGQAERPVREGRRRRPAGGSQARFPPAPCQACIGNATRPPLSKTARPFWLACVACGCSSCLICPLALPGLQGRFALRMLVCCWRCAGVLLAASRTSVMGNEALLLGSCPFRDGFSLDPHHVVAGRRRCHEDIGSCWTKYNV